MRNQLGINYSYRRGLSFIEFLGCMTALVGGVVLGSMYLGIDVKAMAVDVLAQTTLRPAAVAAAEEATATDESEAVETAENQRDAESAEGVAEPTATDNAQPQGWDLSKYATDKPVDVDPQATLVYWQALSRALADEAAHRAAPQTEAPDWQLFDFLTSRQQGHQAVVDAIAQLDGDHVEPRVVEFARRANKWHASGANLYSRALELLTDSPGDELDGPLAQSWQSAATQHRMEERLLIEKRRALESYMRHRKNAEQ